MYVGYVDLGSALVSHLYVYGEELLVHFLKFSNFYYIESNGYDLMWVGVVHCTVGYVNLESAVFFLLCPWWRIGMLSKIFQFFKS